MKKMRDVVPGLSTKNFTLMTIKEEEESKKEGTIAYVHGNDDRHIITLSDKFFTYPLRLDSDSYKRSTKDRSQIGIIAHELSHFADIWGTDDVRYVTGIDAHTFAHRWGIGHFNADSFAYYLEFSGMENLEGSSATPTPMLDLYAENLSQLAKRGELDPAWGREEEVNQVISHLSSGISPVLVGEAGVGKTKIAESLAAKIAKGDVPAQLKNAEICVLNISALTGGEDASRLGVINGRINGILQELEERKKQGKPIFLFIDEIHMIRGAGASSAAKDNDLANIMKTGLADGRYTVIGATTLDEYRNHIESDPALDRRFEKVIVNEPNLETADTMLDGLAKKLEKNIMLIYP